MKTFRIDLHIPHLGKIEYQQGSKRIIAYRTYNGNKQIIKVYYYDEEYDRIAHTKGCCCQSPTFASTEAGALRQINKFFKTK
jgi:hypothetical protein